MAIVTAGMHPPALLRGTGERVLLVDMQRVHVGAQRNCTPSWRRSLQGPDDACSGNSTIDRDSERFQKFGNKPAGFMLLDGRFGLGMNLTAP